MDRIFTESVGKHKKGDRRDYPRATWERIAKAVKRPLDKFTAPVGRVAEAAVRNSK